MFLLLFHKVTKLILCTNQNGPTNFEKVSTMHVEPPKFQAPPSQDQKHEEPVKNYEQNIRSSMNSQNFASTDTGGIQASSATSHPDVRPDVRNSGMLDQLHILLYIKREEDPLLALEITKLSFML